MCSGKGVSCRRRPLRLTRFNEARAVCSGKASSMMNWVGVPFSFNEARAVCSGKVRRLVDDHFPNRVASMRPERCARERNGRADRL